VSVLLPHCWVLYFFPLDAQNGEGDNILHTAVDQKKVNTIEWLNKNYPELHIRANRNGQIALHYAAEQGNKKLYEQLNPTEEEEEKADNFGQTPLDLLGKNESKKSKVGGFALSLLTRINPWFAPSLAEYNND